VDQRGPECDPSDIQELWVRVFKRQGRIIYPEQERIFRKLERSAIQGSLGQGDLDRADKVLRMFKAPGTLDRNWAKAELLTDLALSGGVVAEEVLLSEHKQTSRGHRQIDAIDPIRTCLPEAAA
jgi:hypothetical protein